MLEWLGKTTARRILEILGFKAPSPNVIKSYQHNDLIVVAFSHTSDADVILQMLYMIAYPFIGERCYTIVSSDVANNWPWLRNKMGCISTSRNNTVNELTERFKDDRDGVRLMIAPKGHRKKAEWKGGYYHIAVGLKADIVVGGIDYDKREICFGPHRSVFDQNGEVIKREDIEPILKRDMSQIVPYHPEYYTCNVRKHDRFKLCVMDAKQALLIACLISFIVVLILITVLLVILIVIFIIYIVHSISNT
jgi:ABC-type multidrug transport system fused ATPase/permease subunit